MDVLDTDPTIQSGPVPPTYDLSQQEYESKVDRVVQQSLRPVSNGPQPSRSPAGSPGYGSYDTSGHRINHLRSQSLAPGPVASSTTRGSQSRPPSATLRMQGSPHHRQNSISSSSGNSSNTAASAEANSVGHAKERPTWYAEAGLGAPSPRLSLSSPAASTGPSSHPISPVEGPSTRLRIANLLDEEAGIDSPPPPFAPKPPPNSLPVSAALLLQPTQAPSSSGYCDSPATARSGSPGSYYVDPQPPPPSRHKKRTSSFNWQPETQAGPSWDPRRGSTAPRLAFNASVAYSNDNNSLPPGAAPVVSASAFYSSAVSSIIKPPSQTPSSNYYIPGPSRTNPPPQSEMTPRPRQSSQNSSTSPLQTPYAAPTHLSRPSSAQSNASRATSFDQPSYSYSSHRPPSRSSTSGTITPAQPPGPPPGARPPVAPAIYRRSSQEDSARLSPAPPPSGQPSLYGGFSGMIAGNKGAPSTPGGWMPPGAAAPANVYERRFG